MATSPIYSWPEPDDTSLVKDGALAMRNLGNAIDTTMATMVAKTIVDAKGDIIAATAADTVARLPVGTNGQALKANSATATGLEWGSVAATKTYSLLGTGALTSGSTVTVSGISGIDSIYILVQAASTASTQNTIGLRINGDTGTNYSQGYVSLFNDISFHPAWLGSAFATAGNQFSLSQTGNNQSFTTSGAIEIAGCATSGVKMAQWNTGCNNNASQASNYAFLGGGAWNNSAAVTSVSLVTSNTFDAGNFYVYGAA
jgi:hypothetical protein